MGKGRRRWMGFWGGIGVGLLNGLLGAGGGLLTIPLLERMGVTGKRAHATSLAVILPLSAVSGGIYLARGWVRPGDVWPFLPAGVLGAWAGGWLLGRLNTAWVKGAFAALAFWAGVRGLLR